ncbi:MAG: EpsI family protein [Comamonadaceae bacterium]|jgi:EpsI family protein|nr:MAG: EpsI family protein [Comamonadaceae bacterium]
MEMRAKSIVMLALMLFAAFLGAALRPTIILADELAPINLKTMVPIAFGDWQEQPNASVQIIDPQQKETLERIYSETLSRTYVSSHGDRIMLSIAYGKNQSKALELHVPEICYPAQGFALLHKRKFLLNLSGNSILATRLQTNLDQRFEPVTYWTVVGDQITTNALEKRLTEMRYAMHGQIPDGMLVRVSSIDKNSDKAYALQSSFARDLIQAISPDHRSRFAGKSTK